MIQACDGGTPALCTEQDFLLTMNFNLDTPNILTTFCDRDLLETQPGGVAVSTINAFDSDAGVSDLVFYLFIKFIANARKI